MLPLLQIPPHAVTPPNSSLDSYTAFANHDAAPSHHGSHNHRGHRHSHHGHHYSRGAAAAFPSQRSFPIRTSQPQPQRRTNSSTGLLYPPFPEHHLRRKTPNGTIDAGYDGSPTQLSPGPPPLKHMVLPGQPSPSNFLPAGMLPFQQSPPGLAGPNKLNLSDGAGLQLGPTPWQSMADGSLQFGMYQDPASPFPPSGPQFQTNSNSGGLGLFPDAFQPFMRANEYNVRAFCPPPAPVDESLLLEHIPMHAMPSTPWGYQPLDHTVPRYVQNHDISLSALNMMPDLQPRSGSGPSMESRAIHESTQNAAPAIHAPLFDSNASSHAQLRTTGIAGQPGFREKALAQAYRHYLELLSFAQARRRSRSSKSNSRLNSPKLLVYPKPPKPFFPFSTTVGAEIVTPKENCPLKANHPHLAGSYISARPPHASLLNADNLDAHWAAGYTETVSRNGLGHGGLMDSRKGKQVMPHSSTFRPIPSPPGKVSPIENAKSSLDVLNSLCEQSGWSWIDGMLLGGCLHYGMEHYEEALEWFSRITTLDSSHVEAITNTAATLYCLDRQEEAKQHWLKAVKLRPGYLEAAEHLVGLLYKKRSLEAIDIINYVQQALKCQSHRSLQTPLHMQDAHDLNPYTRGTNVSLATHFADLEQAQHHEAAFGASEDRAQGFGSSGYAIPGKENGRIVALIHAKGTMLYSLKQVDKASEAFEEAVLISTGRSMAGIQDLVRRIQTVLSPTGPGQASMVQSLNSFRPLLLPPEKARHTAQLVFGGIGELPGLCFVPEGTSKRSAVQTTSNSLLSLAKIFQDAMSNGSTRPELLRRPSGVGDILALYYLSLSLQESPSTANNVGILLAGVQQTGLNGSHGAHETTPRSSNIPPGIVPGSGLALALAYYHYGLRLDPKHVHLHTNLGSLLKDIGQLDLAIQMYEQAVSCDGTFDIALTNLANAVKDRGRINDAIAYYKRAVNSNPEFAEAVCGLLTALNSVCDWRGRGGIMLESGRYDRWHVDDSGLLVDGRTRGQGSGLTRRVVSIVERQLAEASRWGCGILDNESIASLAEKMRPLCSRRSFRLEGALQDWAGKPWEGSRLIRLAERATRVAQRRWYADRYLAPVPERRQYMRPSLHSSLSVPSAPTVLPFHTFTCPLTAKDIRVISQRNAIRISCSTLRLPWISATVYPPPPPPSPQLNVGYVSSDFNNHPLAHLMQSVFGFHDPRRVRAFCYATTASDRSVHRQQIEREAPVFREVSSWPSDKLVEQIVQDNIHILVNLNGYTRGARNEIFAARPAPIQMSFMGFAGTLGAEWCDYILADSTAIPPETLRPWRSNVSVEDLFRDNSEGDEDGWMYSENIIFCRDTFFCCDHAQSCDAKERQMTWQEEQHRRWKMRKELFPTLPDDTIILGNFNQLYKIEPTTFRSWLRILARVPKAILWLLRFPELGEANLRRTAKAWAGAEVASRLVFTDVAPKSQHISRARVCDLFLDTPECNAHTTAADVLWSSTPLLTLPRYPYKMCSRMAASILKGALPKSSEGRQVAAELIAADETEYEQKAIRLANGLRYSLARGGYGEGHGRLAEMRRLLWDSKWQCGLFDTRRWVRDVETAYEEAWRRWVADEGGDIFL